MYIESITISGLRSFKSGKIENLSPGQNVIVGPNGSGKSNIVTALELVLTPNYSRLNQAQRNELLCNINPNVNRPVTMAATIAVVINNSDRRFPQFDETVEIKRTISRENDQFHLNKRLVSHEELLTFLESGGFSSRSSHFLIGQGFVSEIAFASPKDLLNILRNLCGSNTFDDKKQLALKCIEESENQLSMIEGNIARVNQQLSIFNLDRSAIENYRLLKKIRKFLEFKLSKFEINALSASIAEAESVLAQTKAKFESEDSECKDCKQQLDQKIAAQNELKQKIERIEREKASYRAILDEEQEKRHQLEASLAEQQQILSQSETQFAAINAQLDSKRRTLHDNERRLAELEEDEKQQNAQIAKAEEERKNYYNLLTLEAIPTSEQRNEAIESHLAVIESATQNYATLKRQLGDEKAALERKQLELQNLLNENSLNDLRAQISAKSDENAKLINELDDIKLTRKKILLKIPALEKELMDEQKRLTPIEEKLNYISVGLAVHSKRAIEQVLENARTRLAANGRELSKNDRYRYQMILDGYHGQFIDLVRLNRPGTEQAIEALLQNQIFYHFVQNERVASALLREIERLNASGTSTATALRTGCKMNVKLIALNRVKTASDNDRVINGQTNNCVPLLSIFDFDNETIGAGVRSICDRRLICDELLDPMPPIGSNDYANLLGDSLSRTGIFIVGSDRQTRYELYREWQTKSAECESLKRKLASLHEQTGDTERLIERKLEQISGAKRELACAEQRLQAIPDRRIEACRVAIEAKDLSRKLDDVREKLSRLIEQKSFWELFRSGDDARLRDRTQYVDVRRKCERLTAEIDRNRASHRLVKSKCDELNHSLQLERLAIETLERQQTRLLRLQREEKTRSEDCVRLQQQLRDATRSIDQVLTRFRKSEESFATFDAQLRDLSGEIDTLKSDFERRDKSIEKLRNRVRNHSERLDRLKADLDRHKAEELDREAEYQFQRWIPKRYAVLNRRQAISAALHSICKDLDRLAKKKVNEESIRRCDEMSQTVDEMEQKKNYFLRCIQKARDILELLVAKKQDIALRTYKQVNIYFQENFHNLTGTSGGGTVEMRFLRSEIGRRNSRQIMQSTSQRNTNNNNATNNSGSFTDSWQSQSINTAQTSSSSESTTTTANSSNISLFGAPDNLSRKLDKLCSQPGEEDDFIGLEILASFGEKCDRRNGDAATTLFELSALSGGQKSIVLIAFITALQRVDETPFLIFDEIDCNLDHTHRQSLADFFLNQKNGKQLIFTTFHPELCELGDQFYRVENHAGLSSIQEIECEQALQFVLGFETGSIADAQEEEEEAEADNLPDSDEIVRNEPGSLLSPEV